MYNVLIEKELHSFTFLQFLKLEDSSIVLRLKSEECMVDTNLEAAKYIDESEFLKIYQGIRTKSDFERVNDFIKGVVDYQSSEGLCLLIESF